MGAHHNHKSNGLKITRIMNTTTDVSETLRITQFILSILGSLLSFALFASPYRLMQSAYQSYVQQNSATNGGLMNKTNTVNIGNVMDEVENISLKDEIKPHAEYQKISSFTYLSMFINCLFWVTYGVLSDNFTLVFVNFVGFVFACYYNWLYFKFTSNRESFLTKCSITLLIYILALGYVMFLVNDHWDVLIHLGFMAACSSIIMIGSPLSSLKEVIEKKDASSIPLPICVASSCCALVWMLYGVSMGDRSIIVPNLIGSILGAMQLGLKAIYQKKRTVFSLLPLSGQ
jgi:solute carrier family 50 protein (sugar transporter)